MKTYTICRTGEKPDWSKIPVLAIDSVYRASEAAVQAFAQIAYHDTALCVHLWAKEKAIRAEEQPPYGESCKDSCLEFFFSPLEGDLRYFNIELSPTGCMYLGYGSGLADLLRIVPDYTDRLFEPVIERQADGWSVEYQVPYAFIRRFFPEFSVQSGKTIRANCYKCGDCTEIPHFFSWSPIAPKEHMTFHSPTEFGQMVFE